MNFNKFPKIELHCHLDGSVRPETIIEIAKDENITIPSYDVNELKNMLIAPMNCKNLDEYLEKFKIPIDIMQSENSLKRIAYELMENSFKENIKYIEIRFAPLLHIKKGLTLEKVIESVVEGIKLAESKFDIKGNIILSCLRNMSKESMIDVIESGKRFLNDKVVAIDLCGSEEKGFCEKFIEPVNLARKYGYRITIHAGETGVGENVADAIELLYAERIGHGVFIKECDYAYNITKENNIFLEMCPTSNIQTKAVNEIENHPIYNFFKDGIKVTINTDNRTVSNTTLTNECNLLNKTFNLTEDEYKIIYLNSVDACFADNLTKENLKSFYK